MKNILFLLLLLPVFPGCKSDDKCYCSDNELTGSIVGHWNVIGMRFERVSEVSCFDIDSIALRSPTNVMMLNNTGNLTSTRSGSPVRCQYKYSRIDRKFYSFACDSANDPGDTMDVAYLDDEYLVMITQPAADDTSASVFSILFKRIK